MRRADTGEKLQEIHFQEGPIKECGINGVANEDLIAMVICRLQCFQRSGHACRENEMAIEKIGRVLNVVRKKN